MRYAALFMLLFLPAAASGSGAPISKDSTYCLECHTYLNPGIVEDWKRSRMSGITPEEAMKIPETSRRVSFDNIPETLKKTVVGCAECHSLNAEGRADSFEHNGYEIVTVVSPGDCAVCHPVEADQYQENIMSHAYGNLENNPLYHDLVKTITGVPDFEKMGGTLDDPDEMTLNDSCRQCHGTHVKVEGMAVRDTDFGEMEFPVLSGWPNQGVGRVNPDGSNGACSACHTRHRFSIEMARKPHTCSQCHKGPDVPAYKVYEVSKHGNIYFSLGNEWKYETVPWAIGRDLTAPTCATCHVSLIVDSEGEVLADRTHRMNDRLPWRIFGLIYAHPHPASPDTTIIRNSAGLPLPTDLTGEPAMQYLIGHEEQELRRSRMQDVCVSCHSRSWVKGHFERYDNTISKTNEMTLTATRIMLEAWNKGVVKGISEKDGIFNEALEKKWVEHWLFYANSTRYSSAMGGADYGVFAGGRWQMSKTVQEMAEVLLQEMK
ncbi:MAG: multiheme c-type cytochrome [Desulfatiglandaceae bacterium]